MNVKSIPRICSIAGCAKKVKARGWCQMHYLRAWKRDGPLPKPSLLERFENQVELIPFSTCHYWMGPVGKKGYGRIKIEGKMKRAHRAAYELYIGPIPDGFHVCHTCDCPGCVNPAHLFVGTNQDNMDDMYQKGRGRKARGERQGSAKLTTSDVYKIRELSGELTQQKIGKLFKVSRRSIGDVINGTTWKHV